MGSKIYTLRFRAVDRVIFDAIKDGKKKVETRAATKKYESISQGDILRFVCDNSEFRKEVVTAKKFNSIKSLLDEYKPEDVNPNTKTAEELEKMYYSFSGYREKIKKYGIVAWEISGACRFAIR